MSLKINYNGSNRTCLFEDKLPREYSDHEMAEMAVCIRRLLIPNLRRVLKIEDRPAFVAWFVSNKMKCTELVKLCAFTARLMRSTGMQGS